MPKFVRTEEGWNSFIDLFTHSFSFFRG